MSEREATEPFELKRLDHQSAIPLVRRSQASDDGASLESASLKSASLESASLESASLKSASLPVERKLDRAGRKSLRFLKQSLLVHGALLAAVGVASCVRIVRIGWSPPELVVGGLGFVLSLPCFLSANTLWRLGRTPDAHLDAHKFAQGIAHLRAMFVLRATLLFATLGVSCFAFSLIAAFIASL